MGDRRKGLQFQQVRQLSPYTDPSLHNSFTRAFSRTLLASDDGQEFAFSPAEMDEGGVTSARSTLYADLRRHLLHSQHDALVVGPSLWDRVPVGSYMHTQQQTCHLELESPTDLVLPDYQYILYTHFERVTDDP